MWRVALDLNKPEDRGKIKGVWRYALGYVPGEPNQGLVAEAEGSPARLPEFNDSGWEVCQDLRLRVSKGLTFAWWRITVEVPESLEDLPIAGSRMYLETNVDDYGEIWVDGEIDAREGTIAGFNRQQRIVVSRSAEPGARHVIAIMAANGPFGKPGGAMHVRYVTLAFETSP